MGPIGRIPLDVLPADLLAYFPLLFLCYHVQVLSSPSVLNTRTYRPTLHALGS